MQRDNDTNDSTEHGHSRPRWTRLDWIALTIITLFGGVIRGLRLLKPSVWIGDERFYGADACWYAFPTETVCEVTREMNLEHPPLAKWIISWAIHLGGETRFA